MNRVVIDVDSLVPYYATNQISGIGRTTLELVHAMEQLEELPVDILLYSQNMKGIGAKSIHSKFRTKHLYLPFRNNWNKILSLTPLRQWLTGYDLYHIPHNFDFVHHPEKTIITLHDTLFFTFPEEAFNYQFAQQHYTALAQQCRGIITCSQSSKRDIIRYMHIPEEKICVIPWGVNHDTFRPLDEKTLSNTDEHTGKGKKTFLCVSCSKGRKNTISVVKAYTKFIKGQEPDKQETAHDLTLVWKSPSKEVTEIIRQGHLRHKIHIVEGLTDQELARYYNRATCSFFPSRYEGFGLPILESMACGTPVVTCRNSSLQEIGGDAALYVEPDDIEGMSQLMTQFEEETLKKADYQKRCLTHAAGYTWKTCAEQTVQYYLKNLGTNR